MTIELAEICSSVTANQVQSVMQGYETGLNLESSTSGPGTRGQPAWALAESSSSNEGPNTGLTWLCHPLPLHLPLVEI